MSKQTFGYLLYLLLFCYGVSHAHIDAEPYHIEQWRFDPDFSVNEEEYGAYSTGITISYHKIFDRIDLTLSHYPIVDSQGVETHDHSLRALSPPITWLKIEDFITRKFKTAIIKIRYDGSNPIDIYFVVELESSNLIDYFYQNVDVH